MQSCVGQQHEGWMRAGDWVIGQTRKCTLGFLVRVQITISGPREGTRLCSSPNSGIDERFEDLDLDFELI